MLTPQFGGNRNFAAKSAKSYISHISVTNEDIRVKFHRQIDYRGHCQKCQILATDNVVYCYPYWSKVRLRVVCL